MPAAAILDRAQQDRAAPHATILAVEGVTKSFPGVLALDDVSFTVRAGEVNALVCENGAGKSTLIKLMAGFYAPDAGTITVGGVPLRPDPAAAHEAGVATGDSEKAASAMLVANRGLKGIWAVWDVPGEGVIAAARTAGLTGSDLTMTTCDLGANIAIDMAQDGYTKGTGSQWPIAQARAEAKLAAYGLLGKAAPAYVALPAVPVTKDNILDAWKQVHGVEAPALVKQAAN